MAIAPNILFMALRRLPEGCIRREEVGVWDLKICVPKMA